jgi:hypothetical protein
MPTITLDEIRSHDADLLLPPDPEFAEDYKAISSVGRDIASTSTAVFVAICRNAMPFLPMTIERVKQTGGLFASWRCFIYENDSEDGTKDFLKTLGEPFTVVSRDNGRPHLNFSKGEDRTVALAEYRNACRDWVAEHARDAAFTVVFDADPWGGWSVDGVANTVGHLSSRDGAAGMGSFSLCKWGPPVWPEPMWCQYDGWAARLNHYSDRPNTWFHLWRPPVGSEPVPMKSCFGQLAVYRTANYLRGVYRGGDCEHVHHWRTCGGDCYLSPGSRVVSFWIPNEEADNDRLHRDVHPDVGRGDADENHC